MYEAYVGTTDYEGEDEAQCLAEINKTFSGEYGAFDQQCSRIACVAGAIASSEAASSPACASTLAAIAPAKPRRIASARWR